MDTKSLNAQSQALSPSNTRNGGGGGRRRSNDCNSPEFEFWMVRNPSFPQPNLLSADELFVDGVLRPLHLLSKPDPPHEAPHSSEPPDPEPGPQPESSPAITDATAMTSFSASKRWRDIFRKSEKKAEENKSSEEKDKDKDKDKKKKKKEKKKSGSGASSAELNINIWPFSRSRSAGNASTRPKLFPGAPATTRKVNSAPCSRSNSAGESKSRKWPTSPGRAGVHLGRSSPVWQVRRGGSASKNSEPMVLNAKGSRRETHTSRRSKVAAVASASGGGGSAKAKVLNLNVPICIGHRQNLGCRSDEKSAIGVGGGATADGGASNAVGSGGNLFNLRNFFTKKSIVTSH